MRREEALAEIEAAQKDGRDANLEGANLEGGDLLGARLGGAILWGASLRGAKLDGAHWDHMTVGLDAAPEGALIGWGKKKGHIVKMRIPEDAPRSCATTRKYRAAWVETLEIADGQMTSLEYETEYGHIRYAVGEITRADSWDEDRWNECSHGIHFFLTRREAEQWLI